MQPSEEIKKLKLLCKRLQKRLDEKEVIISSLVQRINQLEENNDLSFEEHNPQNNLPKSGNVNYIKDEKNNTVKEIKDNKMINPKIEQEDKKETKNVFLGKYDEILQIINQKNKKEDKIFKQSFNFNEFTNFITESNITPQNKNQVLSYVTINKKGLLKYAFDNIETLKVIQIFNIFLHVSPLLSEQEKIIVMHDIILNTTKPENLTTFLHPFIKNVNFATTNTISAIKEIFNHRLDIDTKLTINNPEINKFYRSMIICTDYNPRETNFKEICIKLMKEVNVFENKKFGEEIFDRSTALKLICFYMDWDFAYNTIVCEVLGGMLEKSKCPAYVFYLGIITITGKKMIDNDDSIEGMVSALEEFLRSDDLVVGAVAYIFLKQIVLGNGMEWLEENRATLEKNYGIEPDILMNFIC